ncbi:MAG: carboxypeptidase-like regulatory domain-containing protein, partial [Bacteroidetes bacterium]|nr:carboxypeptidase-like regulatory domain-containing protein [Bacteroidota bacterium]
MTSAEGLCQTKTIAGAVLDSVTRTPLQQVSVTIKNSPTGSITDAAGRFSITVGMRVQKITFSITGYHPATVTLSDKPEQTITVLLTKSFTTLNDVVVNARKTKYCNKNNPAVDLIRQVIARKDSNGPGADPYISYKQYEKIRLLTEQRLGKLTQSGPLKKYHFFFENTDTTIVPGKKLNSVYLQEVFSNNYHRRSPESKKQIITGRKVVDFGEFIDTRGVTTAANRLYEDINLYDNSISAFTIQFLSPIANSAPTFYMYFIQDTIEEKGLKFVKLYFTPRNPEDLLLRGTLYITLDGQYAIRKAELAASRHTNLNYVRDFKVSQEFEKGVGDRYHLVWSDMMAYFSPFKNSTGLFGQRTVFVSDFSDSTLPSAAFRGLSVDTLPTAATQPHSFWEAERPIPLTHSEAKTYSNTDSLVKMRSYRRLMDYVTLFAVGYKSAGKFDIGPVGSFYSFNDLEGKRLRLGGRSNSKLSNRLYLEGYGAYGTLDKKWKYSMTTTYSLNRQSIYSYPFNYISVGYEKDTKHPGQESVFSQGNSFFSSFSRGTDDKWLYNDLVRISYVREFGSHFSYNLGLKYWQQKPAGSLAYVYEHVPGPSDTAHSITTTDITLTLRWAPHEQFFQNKTGRRNIINKYPIFTLQYTKGLPGIFNSQYNYDVFHANLYKRCYLSPIGFSDLTVDASYLRGKLPYPILIIPPANQSYIYSMAAYNLMNTQEFINDHYASVMVDHFFGG